MRASAREIMERVFEGLAAGDSTAFRESLSDEFTWTVKGTTAWSRTYRGKDEVMRELMRPLFAQFASPYTNAATRFIADGEWVAVECRGSVATRSGERYDNEYCWICRVSEGRLREVIEYMDTQLADRVLGKP